MKKITFFNYSLRVGGAEQVIVQICNKLCLKYKIEILTINHENNFFKDLDPRIKITSFNQNKISSSFKNVFRYFKEADFDIFVANIWPLTLIGAFMKLLFPRKVIVLVEHCDIFEEFRHKNFIFKFFQAFSVAISYQFADRLICVSQGVKDALLKKNIFIKNKVRVIYNPVRNKPIMQIHKADSEFLKLQNFKELKIIAVGSLNLQKNYMHLIRSLELIKNQGISYLCYIIGEGDQRNELNNQISELGLSENIFLIGHKQDPREYLRLGNVHVLSSIAEGFGLVIVESMQAGTTTVSTDCSSGPAEIIKDKFGYLVNVNDIPELADKILFGHKNPIDPRLLASRASDFDENKIINHYITLFEEF